MVQAVRLDQRRFQFGIKIQMRILLLPEREKKKRHWHFKKVFFKLSNLFCPQIQIRTSRVWQRIARGCFYAIKLERFPFF